jgi:hypothetical protein
MNIPMIKKLWTTYEFASFIALHPLAHLQVVPVTQAKCFCVLVVLSLLHSYSVLISYTVSPVSFAWAFGTVPVCVAYIAHCRSWFRHLDELATSLNTFTVRQCVCACETDRPAVYANIAQLVQAYLNLPEDQNNSDDLLDMFDGMIRSDMRDHIVASFGRFQFKYTQYVLVCAAEPCLSFVDFLGAVPEGMPPREVIALFVHTLAKTFITFPLAFLLAEVFAHRRKHGRGYKEFVFTVFCSFIIVLPSVVSAFVFQWFVGRAAKSTSMLLVMLAVALAGASSLWIWFTGRAAQFCKGWKEKKRDEALEEDASV